MIGGGVAPIHTWYKGFEFRSRTEARWAFCLDQLTLEYQYEWEGFALPGRWYLPDFLIAGHTFMEIKPPTPTSADLLLAEQLTRAFYAPTMVMLGSPSIDGLGIMVAPRNKTQPFQPTPQANILSYILGCYPTGLAVVSRALGRAQSARFEHGERPTIDQELREAVLDMNMIDM
jgi:hypothetical protein